MVASWLSICSWVSAGAVTGCSCGGGGFVLNFPGTCAHTAAVNSRRAARSTQKKSFFGRRDLIACSHPLYFEAQWRIVKADPFHVERSVSQGPIRYFHDSSITYQNHVIGTGAIDLATQRIQCPCRTPESLPNASRKQEDLREDQFALSCPSFTAHNDTLPFFSSLAKRKMPCICPGKCP
jgi:hypothetical protein